MQSTSLRAWESIRGSLNVKQRAVYDIIRYLKSATNQEISDFSGIPINCITPRTGELKEKGLLVFHENRESKTGRTAQAWRVA